MNHDVPPTNHGESPETIAMTAVEQRNTIPDAEPPVPEPAPTARRIDPRWKRVAIVVVAAAATLTVLIVVGRIWLGSYVRSRAEEMGFYLDFGGLSLRTHGVLLSDATVELAGVRGVQTKAKGLAITIDGLTPRHLQADGLTIAIEGRPADVFSALAAWSTSHPSTYRVTGGATGVKLGWAFRAGETPALSIDGGTLQATGEGGTLKAPRAIAFSFPVNGFVARWPADAALLSVGLGATTLADARMTAEIYPKAKPLTAAFTLRRTSLGETAALRKVFSKRAFATATANVAFAKDGGMNGSFSGVVENWVPAHPKAFNRVFRGNRTTASANFVAPAGKEALTLTEVLIHAGAFAMHGGGIVERKGDHAVARADLKGAVPCSELGAAAGAAAGLPDAMAAVAGELARVAAGGNVDVHVHMEADTRHLGAAKFEPRLSVGCQLRAP